MTNDSLKNTWPDWKVDGRPLGSGSYGTVYKAVKNDHGVESCSAIKIISVPHDDNELDTIKSEGISEEGSKTMLGNVVKDFVNEIRIMESFKGTQNIVSVEDYKVVERENEIGWDILIRMELLTPFTKCLAERDLTEKEVIKLGVDICSALELLDKKNIIHRDIKPQNIFVNQFGDYKLGDFGIARRMENVTGGLSQRGTYNYMAPEVVLSSNYDSRVDIYSLGMVLYSCLNKRRLPFLDTEKQLLSPIERETAARRRLSGEKLPPPCEASEEMADLILCACSFDPNERFLTPTAMKKALLAVSGDSAPKIRTGEATESIRRAEPARQAEMPAQQNYYAPLPQLEQNAGDPGIDPDYRAEDQVLPETRKEKRKKLAFSRKAKGVIAAVLAAALLVTGLIIVLPKLTGKDKGSENESQNESNNGSGVAEVEAAVIAESVVNEIAYGGLNWKPASEDNPMKMGGESYTEGFMVGCTKINDLYNRQGVAFFELDGEYSSVTMEVGRIDGATEQDVFFSVYLNGELAEQDGIPEKILASKASTTVTIDVNGVDTMSITLETRSGNNTAYGFRITELKKNGKNKVWGYPKDAVRLAGWDRTYAGSDNIETMKITAEEDDVAWIGRWVFGEGIIIPCKHTGDGDLYDRGGHVLLNLKGEFKTLSFIVGRWSEGKGYSSATLEIWSGDRHLEEYDTKISYARAFQQITVDVTGLESVEIRLHTGNGTNTEFILANAYLLP